MAAVLMLVFQNTILSLVASVQIASYDMVRIGDWIEMPSLNADGDVIDMSLHTVTVQNFDKTFTTIPTNKLVTDTFRNWRGMSESGCRRIKPSLFLDQSSVHFMSDEEQQKLKDFLLLDQYLDAKKSEIEEFNNHLSNQSQYNQRRLTNLGTFRAYVEFYLRQHHGIAQNQTILVRQMQPTSEGLIRRQPDSLIPRQFLKVSVTSLLVGIVVKVLSKFCTVTVCNDISMTSPSAFKDGISIQSPIRTMS